MSNPERKVVLHINSKERSYGSTTNFNININNSGISKPHSISLLSAEIPTKIYTLSANERAKLAAKRDDDNKKNLAKPISAFIEEAPAGEIGASYGDLVNTTLNYLNSNGSKIGLLKYKLKKGVPEFASTEYRGGNGKPLSIKALIKHGKGTGKFDIYTMRALRSLHRLNTAMRMYKSFTKFLFVAKNYGTQDQLRKFVGATVKRRFKNTLRRIAKKQNKDISQISNADIKAYADGLSGKIERGASKNASNLKSRVLNAFTGRSKVTDTTKNITPLWGKIDFGAVGGTAYLNRPIKDEWNGIKVSAAQKQEINQTQPVMNVQQAGGFIPQNIGGGNAGPEIQEEAGETMGVNII